MEVNDIFPLEVKITMCHIASMALIKFYLWRDNFTWLLIFSSRILKKKTILMLVIFSSCHSMVSDFKVLRNGAIKKKNNTRISPF